MLLPDGRVIKVPPRPAPPNQAPKRIRRKKAAEFAEEQPWLVQYLINGLVDVREGGHVKQALKGVLCSAGRVIRYTSHYQEIDKKHADRTYSPQRKLRTADFSHLGICKTTLGSGGFLRTSDFHQTLLCGRCQNQIRRIHAKAIRAASIEIARKRLEGG